MSPSRFEENSENVDSTRSPSPSLSSSQRRSSIEKLKQASRVRNSNIFALESKDAYDPTTLPIVERPSANRPFSQRFEANTFARFDSLRKENNPLRNSITTSSPERKEGHKRSDSQVNINFSSPTRSAASVPLPASPDKQGSPSPTKSSLSRTSQFGFSPGNSFDPENGTWSDSEDRVPTPRALHRHAKSVTFHEEPPVVNEYEQQTPEPSVSAASDREGSWDSDDFDDQNISFDRGSSLDDIEHQDDSFDRDLENADKTPVVLPEDWSRMSPDYARVDLVNNEDDVFEQDGEPTQRGFPGNGYEHVEQRIASDGSENRPLPPLPGFVSRQRRDSDSLCSAAERVAHSPRNLPSPPKRASVSKDEILNMTAKSSLSLQDRLQLIGSQMHEDRPTSKSSSATEHGNPEELTITNLDTGEKLGVHVAETEVVEEDSVLADFSAPRISRESILRTVRSTKFDYEDEDENLDQSEFHTGIEGRPSIAELAKMDPDQPIPSRENSRETSETYDYGFAAAYLQQQDDSVYIKDEPTEEDCIDMSSIPQVPELAPPRSPSRMDDYARDSSVLRHDVPRDSEDVEYRDSESRYSSIEPDVESTMIQTTTHQQTTLEYEDGTKETLQEAMELLTVKDYTESKESTKQGAPASSGAFLGLPQYLSTDDYDFGMKEYTTPPLASSASETSAEWKLNINTMPELQPPIQYGTTFEQPKGADVSPPRTPDSIIHHDDGEVSPIEEAEERRVSDPAVPERNSSIKTGGKLKSRKSHTLADLETMAEQRRLVSIEQKSMPVPSIPEKYREEAAQAGADSRPMSQNSSASQLDNSEKPKERRKPRKSGGRMDLDLGLDTSSFSIGDHDGLGLDSEFDRVIEGSKVCPPAFPPPQYARFDAANAVHGLQQQQKSQFYVNYTFSPSPYSPHSYASAGANVSTRTKKGYLMRQNTKVVVASTRNFSGDSNDTAKSGEQPMSPTADTRPKSKGSPKKNESPRKPSNEQVLKTEPWNGKARRQSIRNASAMKQQRFRTNEPAPPMPGQESAVMSGAIMDEDYAAGTADLEEDVGEGVERGRLFVKVVGVKDLDLPMPNNDRIYFQLTLDNGLHCVTTSSLELGKTAPIGQEFELVVLNDLEFQLTLTTKLPPPPKQAPQPASPSKSLKGQKHSFSRFGFLSSPKKRAEKERLEREAAEAEQKRYQEEQRRKRASQVPTAWDMLHELVNESDGSFARAYVNLRAHEHACFGRPLTVDVPCYNEWALEQDTAVVNSVRSKRGTNSGPIRRPPYVVGNLELQLLYVPKPRGATDDDMPKSMSSAIREMKRASEVKDVVHEGHLSQQGGDCIVSSSPRSSVKIWIC
jgi:hypothetical protein